MGGGQKQYIVHFNITTNSVSVRDKAIRVTAIKKKKSIILAESCMWGHLQETLRVGEAAVGGG